MEIKFLKKTVSETLRFTYDPLNRLIEVTSEKNKVNLVYDPLGRRLSKVVSTPAAYGWKEVARENYLYDGQNEIGAFENADYPKNLRILGISKNQPITVGVELEGKFFAPIIDVQGNVNRLIDPGSKIVTDCYQFTAFGEELSESLKENAFNPWRFASKRLDPETGLIYFGKRYYDPEFARWLTTDPAGFIDSVNLYQYVFNNPFRYNDPDGENVFAAVLSILEIAIGTTGAIISSPLWMPAAVFLGVATVGVLAGYKVYEHQQRGGSLSNVCIHNAWDLPITGSDIVSKSDVSKKEKKKDGSPKSNTDQNKQANDAKKEIEKKLGRELTKDEKRQFHDHITGQGYNYHELVEEGYWLLDGK